jgi:hypothetical protein
VTKLPLFLTSKAAEIRSKLFPAFEGRANLDRWAISVAVALILHGGIAAALLTWHGTIVPQRPDAPFLIDLQPLPVVRVPEKSQTTAQPVAAAVEHAEMLPVFEPAIAKASEAPEPQPPVSQDVAAENNSKSQTEGGGGGAGRGGSNGISDGAETAPLHAGGMNAAPLDTSITVTPSLYGKKAGAGLAPTKKQIVIFRPSKHAPTHPGVAEQARNFNPSIAAVSRTNAVGAHVQDRVRAALARGRIPGDSKTAIGLALPGAAEGRNGSATEGVVVNSIGMTVRVHPGVPATAAGEAGPAALAPVANAGAVTNHAVVNGREMVRPGAATAGIGGPAKNTAGVLSGSMFHTRHP